MKLTHRVQRYGVITLGAFVVDIFLLALLLKYVSIPYYIAVAGTFLIARSIAYVLHRIWAFSDTEEKAHTSYLYYIGFSLLGALLLSIGVVFLVEFFTLYAMTARLLVGVLIIIAGFFLNQKIVFKV